MECENTHKETIASLAKTTKLFEPKFLTPSARNVACSLWNLSHNQRISVRLRIEALIFGRQWYPVLPNFSEPTARWLRKLRFDSASHHLTHQLKLLFLGTMVYERTNFTCRVLLQSVGSRLLVTTENEQFVERRQIGCFSFPERICSLSMSLLARTTRERAILRSNRADNCH